MISFLRGKVFELNMDTATIDVNGVGYEVTCSQNTMNALSHSKDVQLHIHTHVREDALILFGFSSKQEKELFISLLKVNGVGPKMAIKILSGGPTDRIITVIEEGNAAALSRLPKVGKKTAEQIVLTLKGKLVAAGEEIPKSARTDITSALKHLGFKENDVEKVVKGLDPEVDFEEGIRKSLSALTSI